MKKILYLLLFPSLAMAQYQGNGNQKITLGEQSTADGLVWRGLRADTTSKIVPFSDTSAYIILDTVEKTLWLYKAGQLPKWQQVGGSTLDTATMLLPYYRAGRNTIIQAADVPTLNQNTTGSAATLTTGRTIQTNLASTSAATFNGSANITPGVTGTLPVANGGTNRTTMPDGYILHGDGTSVDTSVNLFWDRTNSRLGIGTASPTEKLHVDGKGLFTGDVNLIPTSGITIFTQQSPNVSHGITGWLPNNAYSSASPEDTNNGGFSFIGATDAATPGALNFYGIMGSTTPTSNAIQFRAAKKNGTSIQSLGAAENAIIFQNYAGTDLLQFKGNGDAAFGKFIGGGTTGLSIDNTGTLVRTSSFELKKDIVPINYGLNEILQLNPINFNWVNSDKYGDNNENGFIAEDVMSIIPNSVNADSESFYMDYSKLIPILTKAIQEQQALIKALEQRILILENK